MFTARYGLSLQSVKWTECSGLHSLLLREAVQISDKAGKCLIVIDGGEREREGAQL